MKGESTGNGENICYICLDPPKDVRIQSCGHAVCLACSERLVTNQDGKPQLRCPHCHTTTLAQDLRGELQINHEVTCGICEKSPATLECQNCAVQDGLPLCPECHIAIHKGRMSSHVVTSLGCSTLKQKSPRCATHAKKLNLFCLDDSSLICAHCMLDKHKGHNILSQGAAAKQVLAKLKDHMIALSEKRPSLKSSIGKLDAHVSNLLLAKAKQENIAVAAIAELHCALDKQLAKLKEQINDTYDVRECLNQRENIVRQMIALNSQARLENLTELALLQLFSAFPTAVVSPPPTVVDIIPIEFSKVAAEIQYLQVQSAPELIISEYTELDPCVEHIYPYLQVQKGGVLSVKGSSPFTLRVTILEIKEGGSVDLSGKGHQGGLEVQPCNNGYAMSGASSDGPSKQGGEANGGGGGGGQGSDAFGSTGGAGGGYGTAGLTVVNTFQGKNNPGPSPGKILGGAELKVLHMGSGGGSGHPYSQGKGGKGGNGGGALRIIAQKIVNHGSIMCNGEDGAVGSQFGSGGGGGSGGSLYLQASQFENKGTISATGGKGGGVEAQANINVAGGAGGDGRVRLDIPKNCEYGKVIPQPYLG